MTVFAVLPLNDQESVESAIRQKAPDAFYALPSGQFLVAFPGTSKELSDMLGISDRETASAIVVRVDSYYGRAPRDVWEWIKSRSEA